MLLCAGSVLHDNADLAFVNRPAQKQPAGALPEAEKSAPPDGGGEQVQ